MLQYYKERFGYILTFTALLVFVEVSHAFQPRPNKSKTASTQTEWASFDTNDPIDILSQSNNPKVSFEVVDKVDLDKAREFAGILESIPTQKSSICEMVSRSTYTQIPDRMGHHQVDSFL